MVIPMDYSWKWWSAGNMFGHAVVGLNLHHDPGLGNLFVYMCLCHEAVEPGTVT